MVRLTSELRSYLYWPLQISAGDLSNDSRMLEGQLSVIFELAGHWKAHIRPKRQT